MANSSERALPPIDLSGSASKVAERWRQWKRSYEYYIDGKGVTQAGRKKSQLLHLAGPEVQDIFEDLVDPGPINATTDDVYKVCIRKLDAHFRADDNVPYERHVFRHMAPLSGESADKFLVRLKKQARHCNFGEALGDNLRDQLIEKLSDIEWKKKLLEVRNISLEDAMDKIRLWEQARDQVTEMTNPSEETGVSTNAVGAKKAYGKTCFSCGKEGHFSRDRNCPAKGRKCSKCGKYGHFARCCKTGFRQHSAKTNPAKQPPVHRRGPRQLLRGKGREANLVDEVTQSSEDNSFAFTIEEQTCALSNASEPVVTVKIGGISKEVLVDSGSASNLISQDELKNLQSQGLNIELQSCSKKLYAYGGQKLEVVGQFKSELAVQETKVLTHFIVVKRGRCLVGYSTATELGILHVGPVPKSRAASCNTVGCPFVESLKAKFPGVFSGVGRLKNYQLKLHIDPQVIPVVQKMRRIPFSLKDKVTAKVNELLENDIIERVEGPTTWISPVVVAPKPSGDIRLCVDMRRANEAIIRERLPIPTVDEVLESLNGSTVFSKLDLR